MLGVALQGNHVQCGDAGCQVQKIIGAGKRQARKAGHHCRAVHQGQGFLGPEHQGLPAQFAVHVGAEAALALEHHLALARERRGHVGQRGEVATGAYRTLFGDQRQDVVGNEVAQALEQFQANTGYPVAERPQACSQHCACGRGVQQLAEAATVEGVEVAWQRLDVFQRHGHDTGVAVAGGHAVDHPFLVEQGVEKARPAGNALAVGGIALQVCRGTAFGQRHDVFDSQRRFAERDRFMRLHRHRSSRKGRN